MENVDVHAALDAIDRAASLDLDDEEVFGILGRLMHAPGAVKILSEALDQVEQERGEAA